MSDRWEFTGETRTYKGRILRRIKYYGRKLLGGWIEHEHNLDKESKTRLCDNAMIMDNARVEDNAFVGDNVIMMDGANVSGSARLMGNAIISGNATIKDHAIISDYARVQNYAKIQGNARVCEHGIVKGTIVGGDTVIGGTATFEGRWNVSENIYISRGIWLQKPMYMSTPYGQIYETKPNVLNVTDIIIRLRVLRTTLKIRKHLESYMNKNNVNNIIPFVELMIKEIWKRNRMNPVGVRLKSCSRSEIYHPDLSIKYVEPAEAIDVGVNINPIANALASIRDSMSNVPRNYYYYDYEEYVSRQATELEGEQQPTPIISSEEGGDNYDYEI
jgi:carbonic anhydrase/acetyltransferase-like protein (isoleucine patch superfamily)